MDGGLGNGEIVQVWCDANCSSSTDIETVAVSKSECVGLNGVHTVSISSRKKVSGYLDGTFVCVHCATNAVELGGAAKLIERGRKTDNRSILGNNDDPAVRGLPCIDGTDLILVYL